LNAHVDILTERRVQTGGLCGLISQIPPWTVLSRFLDGL
jgi:hypothetical protein